MAVYAGQTNVHKEVKKLFIGFGGQWLEAKKVYLAYNNLWREAKVAISFTPPHTNSLIFDGTSYLEAFPISATDGDRQKYIFSAWVYRSKLGSRQMIVSARVVSEARFEFNASDQLSLVINGGGANVSDDLFRDVGWYQVGFIVDTTEPVASNRIKIMVNGTRTPSTGYEPPLNDATSTFSRGGARTQVGSDALTNPGLQYNGGMTDLHFLDGIEMTEQEYFDTFLQEFPVGVGTNTMSAPTSATVASYGADGWSLKFDNSLDFGEDSSGNGHDFSVFGFVPEDQSTDVPGNPYAVLSHISGVNGGSISEGGLSFTGSGASTFNSTRCSLPVLEEGCYFELMFSGGTDAFVGFYDPIRTLPAGSTSANIIGFNTSNDDEFSYRVHSGQMYRTGVVGPSYTGLTPNTQWGAIAYKNGNVYVGTIASGVVTWFNSGDPIAETGAVYSGFSGEKFFGVSDTSGGKVTVNFGQRSFQATPPTGFLPLRASNMPTPLYHGRDTFNTLTYIGQPTGFSLLGAGFQPDLFWGKARSNAFSHRLEDSVRGAGKGLFSNTTLSEETRLDSITSFDPDGVTFGTDVGSGYNENGVSYVGWAFKAGGAPIINNEGSVASLVSVAPEGHFSIITDTGDGSAGMTVGHGLPGAPDLVIRRPRSAASWYTYTNNIGMDLASGNYLILDGTSSVFSDGVAQIHNGGVGSTTLSTGGNAGSVLNSNGTDFLTYCFRSVPGLCKVGSYIGNGSTNGPFIDCGFKPRWVLSKRTPAAGAWNLHDTERDEYNPVRAELNADTSASETTAGGDRFDVTSSGFKIRSSGAAYNTNGSTYIYLAIAEETGGGELPWPLGR